MAGQRHDSGAMDAGEGRPLESAFPERLERFLSECVETILDRIGPARARCIYLCGSFAAGEGSVAFTGGLPLFLSDIDLVLVADSEETHADVYPYRRALGAACEARFPEARFHGQVDIGVLLAGELGSLSPSPGVFDMRRLGRVLYGDASVLEMLPAPDPGAIGPDAARLLCENRIASMLATAGDLLDRSRLESPPFRYALSRVYTDIATAELCSAGAYRPGYAERLRWLREDPGAERIRGFLGQTLLERIGSWTAYKLRPVPETVPSGSMIKIWLDAASDILGAWRRAAAASAGIDGEGAPSLPTEELIGRTRRRGSLRDVIRSWRAYEVMRNGNPRFRAFVEALPRMRAGMPDDVVRGEAVFLMDAAATKGLRQRVTRPDGGFPHDGGTWHEAASATSRTWKWLVYGDDFTEPAGRRTVVILIDALGDEIAREHRFAPTSLGHRARLRTVLGFSQAALTSIMTGATPAEHGLWMMYRFDRRRSPFRFLGALAPVIGTDRRLVRGLIRWKIGRLDRFTGYYSLYSVPARVLARLDLPARRSIFETGGGGARRTVLDEAATRGEIFVRDYLTPSDRAFDELEETLRSGRTHFHLLYTAELDADLHSFGTRDRRIGERLDRLTERIDKIASAFPDIRLLVLGDHGMCDVTATIDVMGEVDRAGLGSLRDMTPFYDSTMARFSLSGEADRRRLEELLSSLPGGRMLTRGERAALGVPQADDGYGDVIFLCDPGVVILPSHMGADPVAGMHGYHPDAPCMDSVLLSRDPIPPEMKTICDVAPLLLPGFEGGEAGS